MRVLQVLVFLMMVSSVSVAQDYTTNTPAGGGDWSNSAHWVGSNKPDDFETGNFDEVLIAAGDTMRVSGALEVNFLGTLDVQGVLIVSGGMISGTSSTIRIGSNGHLDVAGSVGLGGIAGGLNIDIESGGKFDIGGAFAINGNNSSVDIDGEMNVAGGGFIWPHTGANWEGDGIINFEGAAVCGGVGTGVPDPLGSDATKCFDTNNPLPVELLSFEAKELEGEYAVVVNWTTASEIDNDFFEIQRGLDLESFETIGVIDGNGTTKEQIDYEFIDNYPVDGISYYRLKQVDYDGTEFFHVIDYVNLDLPSTVVNGVGIYPNPFTESQYAYLNEDQEVYSVQLINMVGDEFPVSYDQERTRLDIIYEVLESGLYVLNISTSDGLLQLKVIRD